MITKSRAIKSLCPNANFLINHLDNDAIVWNSPEIEQPSNEAIEKEMIRLQKEYDSQEYYRNRALEYPSITEQLDDLFHAGAFSKEMTRKIQAVKNKYPKQNFLRKTA